MSGGLLAEVRAFSATDPRPCGVAEFICTLSDADRDDLAVALADPSITTTAIHQALAPRGLRLRSDSVRRHRGGRCSCPA